MSKRKTDEEFKQEVLDKLGIEYKVLSSYPGCHGKVLMFHSKCQQNFEKNVHDIITKKSGCPYCNGSKPALYNENWVKNNTPMPYHYVSGYVNMKIKCIFFCDKCQSYFSQYPTRLINEHLYGCNCCPTKALNHQDFLDILGDECLLEYNVLGKYTNIETKIKMQHKPCQAVFEVTPEYFIKRSHKKYCPICYFKKSKGEALIAQFLTQNHIKYIKEYSFLDLKEYRFDFFLPESSILLEFDGEQHIKPISYFGGKQGFLNTVYRDKIKNVYCIKNHLILYRIPYCEINNLFQILNLLLIEKSSTTIEKFLITEQSTSQVNGDGKS